MTLSARELICDRPLIFLDKGHISKFCKKSNSCRKCTKRLSISICTSHIDKLNEQTNANSNNTTSTYFSGNNNSLLLQTAEAATFSSDNKTSRKGRILFDGSGQGSYITKKSRI